MKKIFLHLALIIILSFYAFSQWEQCNNGMSGLINVPCLLANENIIFAGTSNIGIYSSTDNGNNWIQKNSGLTDTVILNLTKSGSDLFAFTLQSGIFISTNNGDNWISRNAGLTNETLTAFAVQDNIIYAGTQLSGVYYSTDKGNNWAQTSLNNIRILSLSICGDKIYAGTRTSGLFVSPDSGKSWSQKSTGLTNNMILSVDTKNNKIYAGSRGGGIYISSDSGSNWSQSTLNYVVANSIIIYDNYIFAGTDYGVYLSTDNGDSWTKKNSGLGNTIVNSLIINNNYIYAGVYAGIYRCKFSEITSVDDNIDNHSEIIIFPNPAAETATIKFEIDQPCTVSLKLTYMLGNQISLIDNQFMESGSHSYNWDASGVSAGVYYYVLETYGRGTKFCARTGKVVVIK
jgi:photosystem II stability/assembly factor-like uncharacterized protein